MAVYNEIYSFVWKSKRYGVNTAIKIKEEFLKDFRWNGEEICNMGFFKNVYVRDGKKMFQFQKYCPKEIFMERTYPICFSFTELELMDAIEEILRPTYPEEVTACRPPFAEKQLSKNYTGHRIFFVREGKYYGSGSKYYVKDEFIKKYKEKTGKYLSKKIMFSHVDGKTGRYYMVCCDDMMTEPFKEHEVFPVFTEEEFYESIEFITDCHTIKYKDKDEPIIFIFWILLILVIAFCFVIFVNPSGPIMGLLVLFYMIRKAILNR